MTSSAHALFEFPQLRQIRDLLRLLGTLADLGKTITTADGLRQALQQVLSLAEIIGLEVSFLDRVRQTLANPEVFNVVLAVVQFLAGQFQIAGPADDGRLRFTAKDESFGQEVYALGFIDWLPFVLQLLELLKLIRRDA